MNVFGVGPLELIMILLVTLIFVGPERLPRMAADLARTIRELRKYTASFAAEFNEVIKEFEKETEAERTEWKEIGEGLSIATSDARREIEGATTDARREIEGASKEVAAAANDASAPVPAPTPPTVPAATPAPPAVNGTANGAQPAESESLPAEKSP